MAYSQPPTGSAARSGKGTRIVGRDRSAPAGPGPAVMAASTLDGDRVLSSDGDEVGKVKEIMLDVEAGRIAYMVMSSGGFPGIGEKLFAVPWNALTLDVDRKCFVIALNAERMKDAPGFDKGHWPSRPIPRGPARCTSTTAASRTGATTPRACRWKILAASLRKPGV